MNPSTNPSAIRSKNEITNALLKLMKQYPYAEISAKLIILESGVSRKTFYRNFESKDDILNSIISNKISEYVNNLVNRKELSTSNVIDVIFDSCKENFSFLSCLKRNNLLNSLLYELNRQLPLFHKKVVSQSNPIFKGINDNYIDYIIFFNIGAIYNIINKWIEEGMNVNPGIIKRELLLYLDNIAQNFVHPTRSACSSKGKFGAN